MTSKLKNSQGNTCEIKAFYSASVAILWIDPVSNLPVFSNTTYADTSVTCENLEEFTAKCENETITNLCFLSAIKVQIRAMQMNVLANGTMKVVEEKESILR